jgi:hypothetical protein
MSKTTEMIDELAAQLRAACGPLQAFFEWCEKGGKSCP